MEPKQFRVANPRGVNPGVRILMFKGTAYFEGDTIVPSKLPANVRAKWLEGGYIVEVTNG